MDEMRASRACVLLTDASSSVLLSVTSFLSLAFFLPFRFLRVSLGVFQPISIEPMSTITSNAHVRSNVQRHRRSLIHPSWWSRSNNEKDLETIRVAVAVAMPNRMGGARAVPDLYLGLTTVCPKRSISRDLRHSEGFSKKERETPDDRCSDRLRPSRPF